MTDKYHVVKEKKSPKIYIESNKPITGPLNRMDKRIEKGVASFNKYSPRKPIICSDQKGHSVDLNASRFEPINKDPQVLSTVRRPTGISFNGHKVREELFPAGDMTTFYEADKTKLMGRLTRGYFNLRTQKPREAPPGLGLKLETEDSYDYKSAVEAHTTKTRPKTLALTNFNKHQGRDDVILRSTDMYMNVLMENSKEEREVELQSRKDQNKKYHNLEML